MDKCDNCFLVIEPVEMTWVIYSSSLNKRGIETQIDVGFPFSVGIVHLSKEFTTLRDSSSIELMPELSKIFDSPILPVESISTLTTVLYFVSFDKQLFHFRKI